MNQVYAVINTFTKPIRAVYVKAFNANKYAAGIGFSSLITLSLFFVMVILIALGDSGIKEDKSVVVLNSDHLIMSFKNVINV